jgi:hypothetical protein
VFFDGKYVERATLIAGGEISSDGGPARRGHVMAYFRALVLLVACVSHATVANAANDGPSDWLDLWSQSESAAVSPYYDRTGADRITAPTGSREYSHAAKHLFRYLLEASGADGQSQQEIAAEFARLGSVGSQEEFAVGLDALVRRHSGPGASGVTRGLFSVLPEFFTEYASYGAGRYLQEAPDPESGSSDPNPITAETWIEDVFSQCGVLNVSPGNTAFGDLALDPLAGACVRINWTGFTQPVALQLFAEGAGDNYGNLHIGEALHRGAGGAFSCYGHTNRLSNRIALPMNQKCMLRRGTQVVGVEKIATWTSGFNLRGSGTTYLIVSNVAKDAATTAPVEFRLIAGALAAAKIGGAHIEPREVTVPGGEVGRGMTLMDSRIHAMAGGPDRILFDGRAIGGTGVETGFLDGMPGVQSGSGGLFTFVRGGDYWIGWMGDQPGAQDVENVGFIMKEPGRLDAMAGMFEGSSPSTGLGGLASLGALGAGTFQAPIVAGGMMGIPGTAECGYQPAVTITPVEQSRYILKLRVSADLFDPMLTMSAGGALSGCAALRNMHVELANFELSLPFGLFYESDTSISRGMPDGQEVYDETDFFDGPNFGGILSSRSIVDAAATSQLPEDGTTDEDFTPQAVLAQTLVFTGQGPFQTRIVNARTLQFTGQGPFVPRTVHARTLSFTGQGPFEPMTVYARTLSFTGQGPFEPRTVHARTLKFTGLGPFEPRAVLARTLKFEGQGPFEPQTVLAQTLEFAGQGPFNTQSVVAQTLEFDGVAVLETQPTIVKTPEIEASEPELETATSPSTNQPLVPTVDAQVTYLRRLISDQGLTEDVEQMLLEDFATMSDDTRAYLIKRYRYGYE